MRIYGVIKNTIEKVLYKVFQLFSILISNQESIQWVREEKGGDKRIEVDRKRETREILTRERERWKKEKEGERCSVFLLKTNPYPITRVVHYFLNSYNLYVYDKLLCEEMIFPLPLEKNYLNNHLLPEEIWIYFMQIPAFYMFCGKSSNK